MLAGYALAARQDHPLLTLPSEQQEKPGEDGSPRSAAAWHGAHRERGASQEAPALQDAGRESEEAELLHCKRVKNTQLK